MTTEQYILLHGSTISGPPDRIMRPAATFANYLYKLSWKLHNTLGGQAYHLLLFFHMRPANQPAITDLAVCHKTFGYPCCRLLKVWDETAHRRNVRQVAKEALFFNCNHVRKNLNIGRSLWNEMFSVCVLTRCTFSDGHANCWEISNLHTRAKKMLSSRKHFYICVCSLQKTARHPHRLPFVSIT